MKNTIKEYNIVCVPTSDFIKKNGEGIILKGFPEDLQLVIPDLAKKLGNYLSKQGPIVGVIDMLELTYVLAFPIKSGWNGSIDTEILERSCKELMKQTSINYRVFLPRLIKSEIVWEELKEVLQNNLDSRVTIGE